MGRLCARSRGGRSHPLQPRAGSRCRGRSAPAIARRLGAISRRTHRRALPRPGGGDRLRIPSPHPRCAPPRCRRPAAETRHLAHVRSATGRSRARDRAVDRRRGTQMRSARPVKVMLMTFVLAACAPAARVATDAPTAESTTAATPTTAPTATPEPTPDLASVGAAYLGMSTKLIAANEAGGAGLKIATDHAAAGAPYQLFGHRVNAAIPARN